MLADIKAKVDNNNSLMIYAKVLKKKKESVFLNQLTQVAEM